MLAKARTLEDVLVAEGHSAAQFFMRFRGAELPFEDEGIPPSWRRFAARAGSLIRGKGGVSRARHAASPFGAMLNYSYTVALGNCARAAIGLGFDPCHGFLHSPKPGRLSLAYDTLELHRAAITSAVFAYAACHSFDREDFGLTREGIVRLGPDVARDMAKLALRAAPVSEAIRSVKRIARWMA